MTTMKKTLSNSLIRKPQADINEKFDRCIKYLEEARQRFLSLDGVLGVGYGSKEKRGEILTDEPCLIVYVKEKKDRSLLSTEELIPPEFRGVLTDVVVPGNRVIARLNSFDAMWLDRGKIHGMNPRRDQNLEPIADYDLDNVAIVEIDDTFVVNGEIDLVKATKRFLNSHPDVFDFISFYTDSSTGLPDLSYSFHSGVYNKTKGINYYKGSDFDARSTYGSNKLQAVLSIGWLGNQVLLHETGHMWAAFVRNRDTEAGANQYDLLIGTSGQGLFHWGRFFDNDHSPMDYDGIDWQALGGNQFQSDAIADRFFHYCPLDLYLMGLIPETWVGQFYIIKSPSGNSGTITGTRKDITVQNVIWAEGKRDPAYPDTQKFWKQAFVVLTKDARKSRTFAEQVAQQRRQFNWEFYKATRFLGKVDTTLKSNIIFPDINDISVSEDNDRVMIGWKTYSISTKGRVNYATSSEAFRRDQAHTEPFSTVSESTFDTSHGVLLTGLTANTTYYVEIIAETEEGLVDRVGVELVYTRKTNDTAPPDINNVSVQRSQFGGNKIIARWHTDEPSTSQVYYGTSIPPTQQKYDPYPTKNHSITLAGLAAGTYYISLKSRDAAGNITLDNNGGNYYQVVIPTGTALALEAVSRREIAQQIEQINTAVGKGDMALAIEKTSQFLMDIATCELNQIMDEMRLPENDLEAGYLALEALINRLEGNMQVIRQSSDCIEFFVNGDPLYGITCLNLPVDLVACKCGHPVLSQVMSKVRPSLSLEPHPYQGVGHYCLRIN